MICKETHKNLRTEISLIGLFYLIFQIPMVHAQSEGRVTLNTFYSNTLQVEKSYNVYLPPGYDDNIQRYPVVYFLRLHESEWFDPNLPGRNGATLKEVADGLMASGTTGKMILVGPSTGSNDGQVAGMMDMLRPDLASAPGIGTGKFETYFINDLIPQIDATFRTLSGQAFRGVDGFSFGGYTSMVLALRNPGLFSSVGSYDGTFMWHNLDDPLLSVEEKDDPFWLDAKYDALVGPLFDIPRDIDYMLQHNATNILLSASEAKLDSLRAIRFHLHTGLSDEFTNMRRNTQLVDSMATRGLLNSFPSLVLAFNAMHDYRFADLHASKSLIEHWHTFEQNVPTQNELEREPLAKTLYQNYPNPFSKTTFIDYQLDRHENVTITIYNIMGIPIKALFDGQHPAGKYQLSWNGNDDKGKKVASSLYIYQLQTRSSTLTRKMIFLQ